MAKLDPDNWKSAKDVMDERTTLALKRKREEDGENLDGENSDGENTDGPVTMEKPKAEQDVENPRAKKRKTELATPGETNRTERGEAEEERRKRKAEQRAAKRARKQERKTKAREKREQKKETTMGQPSEEVISKTGSNLVEDKNDQGEKEEEGMQHAIQVDAGPSTVEAALGDQAFTASSSDEDQPGVFSPEHDSGTSSTSSVQPSVAEPATTLQAGPEQLPAESKDVSQTPRERLQAALSQFRAGRKADGADGRGPKNRQELLEQRRQKEEERRKVKKEQKEREREEEARRQDEEMAKRFSPGGSGSLLASPRSPVVDAGPSTNFSFGLIAFDDGTQVHSSLSGLLEAHQKKGPSDPASQLKVAESKKARLAALDEEKRVDIEQKDMWLNAKKRAHGERVRDDTSLLKKALKRQQSQKKKSEKEWKAREEGVQKAKEAKQRKRMENIQKRKEEKGAGKKGKHKVKRPGFEGSFRGRTGGGKKK